MIGSIWKYSLAEIKNAKKFSLFFIFNLTLGLFGFLSLELFKDSLQATMQDRSRAVLGADLAIQSRRPITPEEYKIVESTLPPNTKKTEMIEIFSMAAKKGGRSTLTQIRAISEEFPFYGKIETQPAHLTSLELNQNPQIWIYPELQSQLDVKVGDFIKLGDVEFKISGLVINDSASGISTSMAPRVYMGYKQLEPTHLLKMGSIAWRITLYQAWGLDKLNLDRLRDTLFSLLPSADVQVYTHENASEQMGRLLKYLSDFLGLAALVALFICTLGIGFLCYTFLQQRLKNIAILLSLGMPYHLALLLPIFQIFILSLISTFISFILSFASLPLFQKMAALFVNFQIQFHIQGGSLFVTLICCSFASFFVLLPLILRIRNMKPALLFQDQNRMMPQWDLISLLGFIPLIMVFWGLATWQMHSLRDGSLFFGAFVSAVAVFYGIGYGFSILLKWLPQPSSLSLRWALRDLSRMRFTTLSCFLALAVSLLLLNLIPQIERSIREEIKNPESSKLPGLFLFDIQEEQVSDLQTLLKNNSTPLKDISPLIRARLISVNGEKFNKGVGTARAKNRQEEEEMQFRNRGFNLSYRERLSSSEKIISGNEFSPTLQSTAELSVEEAFAERLGLKLGDILKFDIQSVEVEGRIVNLRKVQWTSFQPNFFVLFQPGFLEGAPKTFLATLPQLSTENKLSLQDKIVEKLPNVSMIDIARLVERLQDVVYHISWSLKIMLFLTLIVGFSVLFSIANQQAETRKWDIGLLKALGSSQRIITQSLLLQFALISFLASSFGFLLSLVFSALLSHYLFNNMWFFDWTTPVLLLLSSVVATVLITWISISRTLKTQARELLNR